MRRLLNLYRNYRKIKSENADRLAYHKHGQTPWGRGYELVKRDLIHKNIQNQQLLNSIRNKVLPDHYGSRIDERIVELPWLLANLEGVEGNLLDAGSSLNFEYVLEHQKFKDLNVTIYTYAPESNNFNNKRISYVYGDLRCLPFRDNWFNQIVCISTLEHIDMDNSIYGYEILNHSMRNERSYEFLKVVEELLRILKPNGKLFITVPYGKYENHGFFQQFDKELIDRMKEVLQESTEFVEEYFQYTNGSWQYSNPQQCQDSVSFNPHTNKGRLDDDAAHCRAICSLIIKKM